MGIEARVIVGFIFMVGHNSYRGFGLIICQWYIWIDEWQGWAAPGSQSACCRSYCPCTLTLLYVPGLAVIKEAEEKPRVRCVRGGPHSRREHHSNHSPLVRSSHPRGEAPAELSLHVLHTLMTIQTLTSTAICQPFCHLMQHLTNKEGN